MVVDVEHYDVIITYWMRISLSHTWGWGLKCTYTLTSCPKRIRICIRHVIPMGVVGCKKSGFVHPDLHPIPICIHEGFSHPKKKMAVCVWKGSKVI